MLAAEDPLHANSERNQVSHGIINHVEKQINRIKEDIIAI